MSAPKLEFVAKKTPQQIEAIRQRLMELPLHRFLGMQVEAMHAGSAHARATVTEQTANVAGVLHGGAFYALLDNVAYLAVVPLLDQGQNATTHDLHVSVLRPARLGDVLRLEGKVRRFGRSLVFCEAEAWVGDKLTATARVTKSLVTQAID